MENEEKRMAWFPAPYLEKLEEYGDEDDTDGTTERGSDQVVIFFPGFYYTLVLVTFGVICQTCLFRNAVPDGKELQGHQRRRDKRSHRHGGGGPADLRQRLVAHQVQFRG